MFLYFLCIGDVARRESVWFTYLIEVIDLDLSEGVRGTLWLGVDSFSNDLILAVHLRSYNGWD